MINFLGTTEISQKVRLKMIFLFQRWNMLVLRREDDVIYPDHMGHC